MLLLSWNVHYQSLSGRLKAVADAIGSVEPDVVTLQEVPSKHALAAGNALVSLGLLHVRNSHDPFSPRGRAGNAKPYHCLIASRWPLVRAPGGDNWRSGAPFPELLGRVLVDAPFGLVDVFTVHIPNGANNGWKKIDTFDTLAVALRRAPDAPRILTGDFNEPEQFRSSGQLVTFGWENKHPDGGVSIRRRRNDDGTKRARADWSSSVRSVLDGPSQHGLRDAYRDRHGVSGPTPVTHRLVGHGTRRCFDHTFVSRHFAVVDCGYHHEWRRGKLSDHSAMWTKLCLRHELPRLIWKGHLSSWGCVVCHGPGREVGRGSLRR